MINNILETHFAIGANIGNVPRVLAIAALLQGWLLCDGFCVPCKCAAMCGGQLETSNKVTR